MTFTFATRKEELVSTYWEFYKEVYNVRPRWMNFDTMTEDELCEALDRLEAQSIEVFAAAAKHEQECIAKFEKLVTETIALGAGNRKTALSWLVSAEGMSDSSDYSLDHFCFLNGLPYSYFKKAA